MADFDWQHYALTQAEAVRALTAKLAEVTRERDELADIVWGKIRGAAPVNTMGGEPAPQTHCAMCGTDCTNNTPNYAYGVRYCSTCVKDEGQEAILVHGRQIMRNGGVAAVNRPAQNPTTPPPPVKDTTDTQVVNNDAWNAWIDSLT